MSVAVFILIIVAFLLGFLIGVRSSGNHFLNMSDKQVIRYLKNIKKSRGEK